MIKDILTNSEEFQGILRDIKAKKNSHSYLFSSPDRFTAREMARLVANALLCPDLCGKCENCIKFQSEHPDVKYFPKKNQLLVEDSNYIVDESFVRPIFADKKIFIIDDFDNSTPASQNKLLKVLEEPNDNMFYLLSTSSLQNVLPTIRSRCFKVEIGAFDKKVVEGILSDTDVSSKKLCLSLGGGYLGKTIELSKKDNLENLFNLASDILCSLKSSKEVLIYSKKILDEKDDILLIFEIISLLLEDLIAIKLHEFNLVRLEDAEQRLKQVSDDYSLKCIEEIQKSITKSVQELKSLTNTSLVVDNFLMNLLEVKYLCK